MIAERIREDIKLLSFDEIIDLAEYINNTLEEQWLSELNVSQKEKELLDKRLKELEENSGKRYSLSTLSEHLQAVRTQKDMAHQLGIELSDDEKTEIDRRLALVAQNETSTIPLNIAFSKLHTWANTK
ncbi:MAG: hypothetical protein AAGI23_10390 [Bacteroidota bacterium]